MEAKGNRSDLQVGLETGAWKEPCNRDLAPRSDPGGTPTDPVPNTKRGEDIGPRDHRKWGKSHGGPK